MNRRAFLAALCAPVLAPLVPRAIGTANAPAIAEAVRTTGVNIRIMATYDGITGMTRFDVMYGHGNPCFMGYTVMSDCDEPPAKMQTRFDPARLPA